MEVVDRALSLSIENIKQYFMMGIPSETEEEAMDIISFTHKVRDAMMHWSRKRGHAGYIGVNLGVFVPKPNLPLNHVEPTPLRTTKLRLKKLVQKLQRIPNMRLNVSSPDLAAAQTVLSMGGIESSEYLLLLRKCTGDWREANRHWKRQAEEAFELRLEQSRMSAQTLRQHASALA